MSQYLHYAANDSGVPTSSQKEKLTKSAKKTSLSASRKLNPMVSKVLVESQVVGKSARSAAR